MDQKLTCYEQTDVTYCHDVIPVFVHEDYITLRNDIVRRGTWSTRAPSRVSVVHFITTRCVRFVARPCLKRVTFQGTIWSSPRGPSTATFRIRQPNVFRPKFLFEVLPKTFSGESEVDRGLIQPPPPYSGHRGGKVAQRRSFASSWPFVFTTRFLTT